MKSWKFRHINTIPNMLSLDDICIKYHREYLINDNSFISQAKLIIQNPNIYRNNYLDIWLQNLTDDDLLIHFILYGYDEKRVCDRKITRQNILSNILNNDKKIYDE